MWDSSQESILDRPNAVDDYRLNYVEGQFSFRDLHRRLTSKMLSFTEDTLEQPPPDDVHAHSGGIEKVQHKCDTSEASIKVMDWTGFVTLDQFLGGGAFGDVYHGKWTGTAQSESRPLPRIVTKKFKVSPSNMKDKKLQKKV